MLLVWRDYVKELFNQSSRVSEDVEKDLREQLPVLEEFDNLYSMEELERAISQMNLRRATGASGIPIEPIVWGTTDVSSEVL